MKSWRLWIIFLFISATTFLCGFLITTALVFLSVETGILQSENPIPWLPLIGLGLSASVLSLILSMVYSIHFFKPLQALIQALDQVASGHFDVRLSEDNGNELTRNINVNFNKMMKELNSIETLQSDFIQNVSHEIKTPLAAIDGYATLLEDCPPPETQKKYVRLIQESSRRLSNLTGNILMLSKLENQQIVSEKRFFPLDEQIRQILLTMEPLWAKKQLNMDLDLPQVACYGREDLIAQVWENLISNAIKFTPKGGTIDIRLFESEHTITVQIRDTGIGMTEEVMSHIFDRFYQGERNRSMEGNGLGLALVKNILILCEGEIQVESKPDCGSMFTVRLPLKSA